MAEPISTATLALKAGEEIAGAIREYMAKQPTESQKQLDRFFELILELEMEIVKPRRNHDKMLDLKIMKEVFVTTILKGVKDA